MTFLKSLAVIILVILYIIAIGDFWWFHYYNIVHAADIRAYNNIAMIRLDPTKLSLEQVSALKKRFSALEEVIILDKGITALDETARIYAYDNIPDEETAIAYATDLSWDLHGNNAPDIDSSKILFDEDKKLWIMDVGLKHSHIVFVDPNTAKVVAELDNDFPIHG